MEIPHRVDLKGLSGWSLQFHLLVPILNLWLSLLSLHATQRPCGCPSIADSAFFKLSWAHTVYIIGHLGLQGIS